jgi:hypothetical protein
MALDFAVLSGLSTVDNWGAIRAEKAQELQRVAMRNALAEQEVQKQVQAGAAIEDYLNTVNSIQVLEKDREKIQQKNVELTKDIQEGIKKFNGNVKKYIYGGGVSELNKYRNNLLQSEEVKRGLTNAYNYNKYTADVAAGLNPRMTSFDVMGQTKQGTFQENYESYLKGESDVLNYRGAFEMPTGDPRKAFSEVFGDPLKRPKAASPMDVANWWYESSKQKGMSDQDARQVGYQKGKEYQEQVKAETLTPYLYKSEDNEMKNLQKQLMRAKIGALSPAPQMNWLIGVTTGKVSPDRSFERPDLGVTQSDYNLSADRSAALANAVNLAPNSKGVIPGDALISKGKFMVGDKVLDLTGLTGAQVSAVPTGKLVAHENSKTGKITYGIEIDVTMNENGYESAKYGGEPIKNWWGLTTQPVPGSKLKSPLIEWNGEEMTLKAIAPLNINPQTFIDVNLKTQETSYSELQNVQRSFGQAGIMQKVMQMGDIYEDAFGTEQ